MTTELTRTDAEAHGKDWGERRSKVVSWHDPSPTTATGLSMPGIDYLHAMIDGTLPPPPISGLMEFTMVSAEPGRVVFTCQPDESAYNPIGTVHGGLVCTLLDSVVGCAMHSTLPQGKGYTSVEIKVNYLKPVRSSSGLLTATGTVVKSGSRVGFAEGAVTDAAGAVVATASSTLLVFDL
ncbi:MAG: PaaI family thioesterase [Mycobacterium sp.]